MHKSVDSRFDTNIHSCFPMALLTFCFCFYLASNDRNISGQAVFSPALYIAPKGEHAFKELFFFVCFCFAEMGPLKFITCLPNSLLRIRCWNATEWCCFHVLAFCVYISFLFFFLCLFLSLNVAFYYELWCCCSYCICFSFCWLFGHRICMSLKLCFKPC